MNKGYNYDFATKKVGSPTLPEYTEVIDEFVANLPITVDTQIIAIHDGDHGRKQILLPRSGMTYSSIYGESGMTYGAVTEDEADENERILNEKGDYTAVFIGRIENNEDIEKIKKLLIAESLPDNPDNRQTWARHSIIIDGEKFVPPQKP